VLGKFDKDSYKVWRFYCSVGVSVVNAFVQITCELLFLSSDGKVYEQKNTEKEPLSVKQIGETTKEFFDSNLLS
jgi:DNA gyrase/topoisomerase IV subunit B